MTQTTRRSTFIRTFLASTVLAGAAVAGVAHAQGYTGPSTGKPAAQGYSGPSTVAVTTVKELLANGRDDQNAILRGRIVSHDGDDHYTFDDGTGQIRVEIDNDDFPAGQKIDDKTQVELRGELDRDRNTVEFDVDSVRVM
ncbi:YgiW/YdeI family stress tolerance OB fold protein [Achromobacter animicus]|uniref:YgiW/YdeI family stress tolerance OB fold protein n=1 Tax=Achromobacter animicus TaxID=1389935 RepID=UPI002447DB3D|nr:NirD/YgiW/YdeI family stress tolerance protein [Achromobacter animicus]MDH0681289.1 NirD/YgiW/YdeI family stress tolerance protein [Achromobacter animicus]